MFWGREVALRGRGNHCSAQWGRGNASCRVGFGVTFGEVGVLWPWADGWVLRCPSGLCWWFISSFSLTFFFSHWLLGIVQPRRWWHLKWVKLRNRPKRGEIGVCV